MSKKNKIFVQFLLDKSGSMYSNWHNTISMIEEYVSSLKADKNTSVRFSLNYFSAGSSWRGDWMGGEDLNGLVKGGVHKLKEWSAVDVSPCGGTALYDAIGNTVHDIQKMKLRDGESVQLVVITDGEENSSRTFSHEDVKMLIDSFKSREWSVVFLAQGLRVVEQARGLGVGAQQIVNINMNNQNPETIRARSKSLAGMTMAYGSTGLAASASFSDEDRKLYEKSD